MIPLAYTYKMEYPEPFWNSIQEQQEKEMLSSR